MSTRFPKYGQLREDTKILKTDVPIHRDRVHRAHGESCPAADVDKDRPV
jgi:hypothetical protein